LARGDTPQLAIASGYGAVDAFDRDLAESQRGKVDAVYDQLLDTAGPLAALAHQQDLNNPTQAIQSRVTQLSNAYDNAGPAARKRAAAIRAALGVAPTTTTRTPGTVSGPPPWAKNKAPDDTIIPPLADPSGLGTGQKRVLANNLDGVTDPATYASVHNAVVHAFTEHDKTLAGRKPTASETRKANQDAVGEANIAAMRAGRGSTTNPDGSVNKPPTASTAGDTAPIQPRTGAHHRMPGYRRTSDIMDTPVPTDVTTSPPAYYIDEPLAVLRDMEDNGGIVTEFLKNGTNVQHFLPNTKRDDGGSIYDHWLASVGVVQGFNAEPDIEPDSAIDAYARAGEPMFFRGNNAAQASRQAQAGQPGLRHPNEQFRDGVYWPGGNGGSSYGRGIYMASASTMGKPGARREAAAYGTTTMKMTLKSGARTTTQSHLNSLGRQLQAQLAADPVFGQPAYGTLRSTLSTDPGYVAALYGYDAYHTTNSDYWVLINRGAVRVSQQDNTT
jgi:hypothetical protein